MNQWQRFVLASREGRYEPHRHDLTGEEEAGQKDANYGAQPAHAGGVGHYQLKEQTSEQTMTNEGIEGTERFSSPGKGRGLRAVRHFAVGELVFACPAYSYVLTVNERGAHCEQCFTR